MAGVCAQGWERVRAVFSRNISSRLEVGASVCIYHRGRCVINLAGGSFNNAGSEPKYDENTLQVRNNANIQRIAPNTHGSGCVQLH